jgi:hypothetical protein
VAEKRPGKNGRATHRVAAFRGVRVGIGAISRTDFALLERLASALGAEPGELFVREPKKRAARG